MKDLLVLFFLIVFIIIAHSRTKPDQSHSKEYSKTEAAIPIQAAFGKENTGKRSEVLPAVNESSLKIKKYKKIISDIKTDEHPGDGIFISNNSANEKCLVHSVHSVENNFLCPYYPSQIINPDGNDDTSDEVLLVRYNN